jgi:hypothetical protein
MSNLRELQVNFQKYLLEENPEFHGFIIDTEKVSAETRLSIYGHAYRSRLIDVLASNYPVLKVYLDNEVFENVAVEYIKQCPSNYRSIRWFGDKLPAFLADHSELNQFVHLSELAQFEWCMGLVFDAADDTRVTIDEMVKIPPESWVNMRLCVHPSVYRMNFITNAVQIWQDIFDEKTPREACENQHAVSWLAWRINLTMQFNALAQDEAWAMDAVRNKLTFNDMCEGLCQWHNEEEAAMRAASLLKEWVHAGLITKVIL